MNEKIKVGIVGYGNIGRGAELAVLQSEDMELVGVFTRRDPSSVKTVTPGIKVYSLSDAASMKDKVDVMILCSGSATDLPEMGPELAAMFNTVDSFDTHARIPEDFAAMDKAAKESGKLALISIGWYPGTFLLLMGGIAYTIGAALYGLGGKRSKWWHSLWHVAVLLGTLLMFLSLYFSVL